MDGSVIILDLDECLVHTMMERDDEQYEKAFYDDPNTRGMLFSFKLTDVFHKPGTGKRERYWGFRRPHLNTYLLSCFTMYDFVVVWSAGDKHYVHNVVKCIFDGIGKPHVVMTRDDVEYLDTHDKHYHKPIQKVMNHPKLKGKVRIEKAHFLDDRVENFKTSPGNGIVIPKYIPNPQNKNAIFDDIALLQVRQWAMLPSVVAAPDIRKIEKKNIFRTPISKNIFFEKSENYRIDPRILATEDKEKPLVPKDILERPQKASSFGA